MDVAGSSSHQALLENFLSSSLSENASPFFTPSSRKFAKNLSLKSAIFSAFLWIIAFIFSFFSFKLTPLCLLVVFFLSGTPALLNTLHDLKRAKINIDVLMTLAAFLAIFIGKQLEGALLLVLFDLSETMGAAVSLKTKGAISKLKDISPSMAVVVDEQEHSSMRSVKEIQVGTHLLIKAGEVIPLDGTVIHGHSSVNLVHLTGESLPVTKKTGDAVQAGSHNLDGTLTIKVTNTSQHSTLSKIIEMIQHAQASKPQFQRFLDRFGAIYATAIILLFLLFGSLLPLFFSMSYLGTEGSIYRSLAFLIAASPCALIIATPTAYLSAISSCAKQGLLLKGGVILDALTTCKTLAFDKTGTLTSGTLSCQSIQHLSGKPFAEKAILSIAYSLERHSTHPIAEAIVSQAQQQKLRPLKVENFKSLPGSGLSANVTYLNAPLSVKIGSLAFIKESHAVDIEIHSEEGLLSAFLFIESTASLYRLTFADTLRPDIKRSLQLLKKGRQLRYVMLTGDKKINAQKIANALGFDDFHAELQPKQKLDIVSSLSKKYGLAMVGDGINDAPALARATVGISLGKIGSAAAIEASDIVILNDKLPLIGYLFDKAYKTKKIVRQNVSFALAVIVLASFPALLGLVPLWLAVLLHEGGTLIVGLNSLRLLKA